MQDAAGKTWLVNGWSPSDFSLGVHRTPLMAWA